MKNRLTGRWLSPKNGIFNGKAPILWLPNTRKVMLEKWNGKLIAVNCILNFTPLGLAHIKRGQPWSMAISRVKVNSSLTRSFQQDPSRKSCQAAIFRASINKDQLKDLHNYSNRKEIVAINTVGGSTSGDNLIESHLFHL